MVRYLNLASLKFNMTDEPRIGYKRERIVVTIVLEEEYLPDIDLLNDPATEHYLMMGVPQRQVERLLSDDRWIISGLKCDLVDKLIHPQLEARKSV